MSIPAIVIVSYNRPDSLHRLLKSISQAEYRQQHEIPLVISIDFGGDNNSEVVNVAESFTWDKGPKKIINHNKNLGLKRHVITCGDLSLEYGSVIVLEDDLLVSKSFYNYTAAALNAYDNEEKVAGISLYSYRLNENIYVPFEPLNDGYDNYFMQIPSSWGQAWSAKQWIGFKKFLSTSPFIEKEDLLPENVKSWPESSWKKYYYKYIVDKDLYFVYPYFSFTTNFIEIGENYKATFNFFQVPLIYQWNKEQFDFALFKEAKVKYDAYFELLPEFINPESIDLVVDLYGTKQLSLFNDKMWLTVKECKNQNYVLSSYNLSLLPFSNNVLFNMKGSQIKLTDKNNLIDSDIKKYKTELLRNLQSYTFSFAESILKYSKEYRLGYYLLHPLKILNKLK